MLPPTGSDNQVPVRDDEDIRAWDIAVWHCFFKCRHRPSFAPEIWLKHMQIHLRNADKLIAENAKIEKRHYEQYYKYYALAIFDSNRYKTSPQEIMKILEKLRQFLAPEEKSQSDSVPANLLDQFLETSHELNSSEATKTNLEKIAPPIPAASDVSTREGVLKEIPIVPVVEETVSLANPNQKPVLFFEETVSLADQMLKPVLFFEEILDTEKISSDVLVKNSVDHSSDETEKISEIAAENAVWEESSSVSFSGHSSGSWVDWDHDYFQLASKSVSFVETLSQSMQDSISDGPDSPEISQPNFKSLLVFPEQSTDTYKETERKTIPIEPDEGKEKDEEEEEEEDDLTAEFTASEESDEEFPEMQIDHDETVDISRLSTNEELFFAKVLKQNPYLSREQLLTFTEDPFSMAAAQSQCQNFFRVMEGHCPNVSAADEDEISLEIEPEIGDEEDENYYVNFPKKLLSLYHAPYGNRKFKCNICGEIFVVEEAMLLHVAQEIAESFRDCGTGPTEAPPVVSGDFSTEAPPVSRDFSQGWKYFREGAHNRASRAKINGSNDLTDLEPAVLQWRDLPLEVKVEWQKKAELRSELRQKIAQERGFIDYESATRSEKQKICREALKRLRSNKNGLASTSSGVKFLTSQVEPTQMAPQARDSGKKQTFKINHPRDQKRFVEITLRAQGSDLNDRKAKSAAQQKWTEMTLPEKKLWANAQKKRTATETTAKRN